MTTDASAGLLGYKLWTRRDSENGLLQKIEHVNEKIKVLLHFPTCSACSTYGCEPAAASLGSCLCKRKASLIKVHMSPPALHAWFDTGCKEKRCH